VLQYDRRAVIAVEHMFTRYAGYGHDLDLLEEIDRLLPHLRFRDFFTGYLRFLAAEVMLRRAQVRP
jgi:hypothetical protein